ncbi:MAG: GNAT family N-acetyltransferase [Marinoscillum sp.]
MQKITLRNASKADVPILQYWDKQPHIHANIPDDFWAWEQELGVFEPWREQLIAQLGERPIGFIQIIDPHDEITQYWGTIDKGFRAIDIWIGEADCLSKGYGTQMMIQAIKRCFSDARVHTILIDPVVSNKAAHRFYKRLGFVFVEQRQFDDDECYVFKLTRDIWIS